MFNRKHYLEYDKVDSTVYPVKSGFLQGSLLGPLLFLLHINDIRMEITKCKMLLYADDMVIFYSDSGAKMLEHVVNEELNRVIHWLQYNNLAINLKKGKTEAILYKTKTKLSKAPEMSIMAGSTKVENATVYEYLGVKMDKFIIF